MHEEMRAEDASEDVRHGKDCRGDELPPELHSKVEHLTQQKLVKER